MKDQYSILDNIQHLTKSKASKTKYYCPVCNGDDLDIATNGKYKCFSGGCESREIREAIDLLKGKESYKPEPKWNKPLRPKQKSEVFYPDRHGQKLIKVTRIDDGEGEKTFPQSHWDGKEWIKGNPDEIKKQVPIYNLPAVRAALEQGETIFVVEGEKAVHALAELGIVATTTIGGSKGYGSYGNYLDDLSGARLVLCPDRDNVGLEYMANFERDFASQIEGYYLAGPSYTWRSPSDRYDIADEIAELASTREQILAKVVNKEVFMRLTLQPETPSGEESDIEELKESVQAKLSATSQDFTIDRLLPKSIAQNLQTYCERIDCPQGLMLAAVLTGYASLMHPDTALECFGGTKHKAKAIIWLGIYGVTGSGKTHSVRPVLAALEKLSAKADEAYALAIAEWKVAVRKKEAWDKAPKNNKPEAPTEQELELASKDKPERDKFTVNNFSIEALLNRLGKQPNRGILVFAAELVGWMLRMDPAKGEAEQNMAMWDGDRIDGDLIGREFPPVRNPRASVMGGVQDDVMRKLLQAAEKIANGFMPRLLLMRYDERRRPDIQDHEELEFTALDNLFAKSAINTQPKEFKFNPDCFTTYQAWNREIGDLTIAESRKSIKALYPKFFTYSLRFTLIAHAIQQQIKPQSDGLVNLETLKAAIAFTRHCMAQTISIYEELLGTEKDDFVAAFCRSAAVKGWMAARDVQRLRSRKFKSKADAIVFMNELVSLGLAEDNGDKPETKNFKIQVFSRKSGRQATKYSKTSSEERFQVSANSDDSVATGDRIDDNTPQSVNLPVTAGILSPDLLPPENASQQSIQPFLSPGVAEGDDGQSNLWELVTANSVACRRDSRDVKNENSIKKEIKWDE